MEVGGFLTYTHIIFDFDGTLVDSVIVQNKILNKLAAKHHFNNISPEDFKSRDNLTLRKKLCMLSLVVRIQSEFKAFYHENIPAIKPFDGLLDTLSLLHENGYKIAIISSNAAENVSRFLELSNIMYDISVISSKGLFGKHKAFAEFVKQHHCKVEDILYIGDEIRDVKACNKSGIDIAFVKWGFDANKDITSYPIKFIASSPLELQQFLLPTF